VRSGRRRRRPLPPGRRFRSPDPPQGDRHDVTTRSAAAEIGPVDAGTADAVVGEIDGDDLGGVGSAVTETVDRFDAVLEVRIRGGPTGSSSAPR